MSAETGICQDFQVTLPFDTTVALRFKTGSETSFRWNAKSNAKFFNAKLLINIKEAPSSNPNNFVNRTLVWEIEKLAKPNETGLVRASILGENFYAFIASQLQPGFVRELVDIDLQVGSGGEAFLNYLEIGQINSGITGADIIPTYTNISGDNYGIFSSRYYKIFGSYQVDATTLDSLESGYRTNNLGF